MNNKCQFPQKNKVQQNKRDNWECEKKKKKKKKPLKWFQTSMCDLIGCYMIHSYQPTSAKICCPVYLFGIYLQNFAFRDVRCLTYLPNRLLCCFGTSTLSPAFFLTLVQIFVLC